VRRWQRARVPWPDVPVRGLPVRRHAQVGASGHRRPMPAGQLHRGRGRFPDGPRVPPAVRHVLRQVDQEQPVHLVRRPRAVLRQPPKVQQAAAVHQVQRAVRQHGREQEIHFQRTGENRCGRGISRRPVLRAIIFQIEIRPFYERNDRFSP